MAGREDAANAVTNIAYPREAAEESQHYVESQKEKKVKPSAIAVPQAPPALQASAASPGWQALDPVSTNASPECGRGDGKRSILSLL